MEQLQRLIVLNSGTAAKPRAIRWKAVEYFRAKPSQFPSELSNVRPKMRKISVDRQFTLSTNQQARGLCLPVSDPEYLGESKCLSVPSVLKHAENHRIAMVIAERHRF